MNTSKIKFALININAEPTYQETSPISYKDVYEKIEDHYGFPLIVCVIKNGFAIDIEKLSGNLQNNDILVEVNLTGRYTLIDLTGGYPGVITHLLPDYLHEDDTTYTHIIENYKIEYKNRTKKEIGKNPILKVTHKNGTQKEISLDKGGDSEVSPGDLICICTETSDNALHQFLLTKQSDFVKGINAHQRHGYLDAMEQHHKLELINTHINIRDNFRIWMDEYKKGTSAEDITFEDFVRNKVKHIPDQEQYEADWIHAFESYMKDEGNDEMRKKGGRTRKQKRSYVKNKITRGHKSKNKITRGHKSKNKTKRFINTR